MQFFYSIFDILNFKDVVTERQDTVERGEKSYDFHLLAKVIFQTNFRT